ncbi:FAST kinase domain-containing protein 2, mitochondrial isoform X2 [Centropristis striata]|uniref:FAST kinase domain-containing protein 2, mitochondrial isoform X2 n=1 Tax=Centropristis striata TaxID=184440 RepID=UPI0027E12649|nr:FAST kinase domain-containing protein 2, mitochondrial isoform X2 [Centropristis striata]
MDVLDLTSEYTPADGQLSNCLNHMWTTTKSLTYEQRRSELQLMFEHPGFERLLQMAMDRVGHMNNEDIVYSLLGMVKLGVSQDSRVVQTFLRYSQENLNKLDEKSLSILANCLDSMEDSENVRALKEGMSSVSEANIHSIKSVVALQTIMRLVGKNAPLNFKKKLERKALSMKDQFSLPNAQYMIVTMASMDFCSKPLLDFCSEQMKDNIHAIPYKRLMTLVDSCRKLRYRNIDLLTAISDNMATTIDMWTMKQVVILLPVFKDLAFCPAALMEAFAEKVIANPEALTRKSLLCVLRVYSSLNHDLQHRRQPFLDSLTGAVDSYLPNMSELELLQVVYHLSVMGHFPPAPLELLLHSSTLDKFNNTAPELLQMKANMFRTVDLCLRLDRPPLPRPLTVPQSVLDGPEPPRLKVNPLLSQGLWTVLGDRAESMLQEMVLVENHYYIDAVITKPGLSRSSEAEGEQSSPAESSHRLAVIFQPSTFYSHDKLAVKIRHLKILGYDTVLGKEDELMSEEKWIDFLRRLIFPEHQTSVEQLGS